MLFAARSLVASLLVVPLALAVPTAVKRAASVPPTVDAPFSVSTAVMEGAIQCPKGIQGRAGGVVFLVHGTGSTGRESWGSGPYSTLLPDLDPGFDICWVDLPHRSQQDVQISAEYVAYGVQYLAPKSKTGRVNVVGHSQGNLNIQWALTFWPHAARSKVASFVSLAGDFKGTLILAPICSSDKLLLGGCPEAVIQQTTNSNFLRTLAKATGGNAVMPTASVYTIYDEFITPELGPGATSVIGKASLYPLQDFDICKPIHVAEHFSMIIDPAAFDIAYKTIKAGKPIERSQFDKKSCFDFFYGIGLNNTLTKIPGLLEAVFNDVISFPTADVAKAEPAIKAYAQPYAPASA